MMLKNIKHLKWVSMQHKAYFHRVKHNIAVGPHNISYSITNAFGKYLYAILQLLTLHTLVYKHGKKAILLNALNPRSAVLF